MTTATALDLTGQTGYVQPGAPIELPTGRETPHTAPAETIALRRTGQRPFRFTGQHLCMAMSFQPGSPFWFEINIFRKAPTGFVADVRLFFKSDGETDRFTVMEFDGFEPLIEALETYDAASELGVNLPETVDALTLPELTEAALNARIRAVEARRQFSGLVGQILYDLDQ